MKDFSKEIYENIQKLIALHESLKNLENPSDPGKKFNPRYDSCINMIAYEGIEKTVLSTKKNNLVGLIIFPVFIMAYTPYATWLRPRKGKNCLRDNLDEEIHNVVYTSEMSSTNLKNRPYNIAYHSEGYRQ
ncbi:PIR Superfamily Protein [Plasmodium ovale curtisi]|uniref:PIR Superfamily Protein n=1 Tax=Plasmodium ovale curtisi TaxID=864141 RepID=A0A1A8WGW5_PLAOA|nr:PIR Superfamily Protein [Plasmodium ovale curtisi]